MAELAILAGIQTFSGNKTFSGTLTAFGAVTIWAASATIGRATTTATYGMRTGATNAGVSRTVDLGSATAGAGGCGQDQLKCKLMAKLLRDLTFGTQHPQH